MSGNTTLSTSKSRPRIGLVLGSGASRGWSHIGVIKALLKEGIEPDIVCGASVGAMIGASYLAGNLEKLEDWVLNSTRKDVLRFFNIKFSQAGFVDRDRMSRFLHNYVAGEDVQIDSLPKPYAAVATNLDNGRESWLRTGGLAESVRASMALPGLFPAVRLNERWLVDGGLVNPVPITTCHALGADIVIAVNLNSDIVGKRSRKTETETEHEPPTEENEGMLSNLKQTAKEYSNSIFANHDKQNETPRLFFAITNSINIVQDRITRSRLAGDPADVMISPRLSHIGMLEFHMAAEAIKEGERCVNDALEQIGKAVSTF
ncbi:MAG: patatin [Xanthomonadales bacterium]|nr:patatin-like phospholipase family protein [Gammaproteobacteria bacterium]NNK05651.1 patatin [Xanthomonadales bacterium]